MKKAFFAVALLIFLAALLPVHAIDWEYPDEVPVNVGWSVYASFESDYDRIELFLDGGKVYETKWGTPDFDHSKVMSAVHDRDEKKLSVIFSGLSEGTHSIEIKTLKDGSVQESERGELEAFITSSIAIANRTEESIQRLRNSFDEFKEEVNSKVSGVESLQGSIGGIEGDIEALEASLAESCQSAGETRASLESLREELNALSSELGSAVEVLGEKDTNTEASLFALKESVEGIRATFEEMNKPQPALAGFVSFVQGNPALAVGLMFVIIVLVVILVVRKRKSGGMLFDTGQEEFGPEVHEAEEVNAEDIDLGGGETGGKKGKWAFGSGPEEKSGFSVTDLLWRKK